VTDKRKASARSLACVISLQLSHVVALSSSSSSSSSGCGDSDADSGRGSDSGSGTAGGQQWLKANQRSKFSNSTFFEAELNRLELLHNNTATRRRRGRRRKA